MTCHDGSPQIQVVSMITGLLANNVHAHGCEQDMIAHVGPRKGSFIRKIWRERHAMILRTFLPKAAMWTNDARTCSVTVSHMVTLFVTVHWRGEPRHTPKPWPA